MTDNQGATGVSDGRRPPTWSPAMQTWMTMEQAAAVLDVSTRTVQRRVAGGDLEARTTDDGRREVLIDDTPSDGRRPVAPDVGDMVVEQHDRALALAERVTGVGQVTADHLAEQARAARRMVAVVGVTLSVVVTVGVVGGVWAAYRIGTTDAALAASAADLDDTVADNVALRDDLASTADQLDAERLRASVAEQRLEDARDQAARLRDQLDEARSWWTVPPMTLSDAVVGPVSPSDQ